jgi:methionyl-tRNA formyltransferase
MRRLVLAGKGERLASALHAALTSGWRIDRVVIPSTYSPEELLSLRALPIPAGSLRVVSRPLVWSDDWADPESDLLVVAGFPWRIPPEIFTEFPLRGINLHGGPLPDFRGGSPVQWQIIQGRDHVGMSIHDLSERFDAGPVLVSADEPILESESIGEIMPRIHRKLAALLGAVLGDLARFRRNSCPQEEGLARYWHQRSAVDGEIDWKLMTAMEVVNLVRAVSRPYPGAFSRSESGVIRIWKAEIPSLSVRGTPGKVLTVDGLGPLVVCREGSVKLIDFEYELADR